MNPIRSILAATLTFLLVVTNPAHAEDIDIYTGSSSGGEANLLIVLDNQSNWDAAMDSNPPADADSYANCGGKPGSYFCAQKYALMKLLEKTDPITNAYFVGPNVGIGLMMYGNGNNKGGYIRFGVRKMNAGNRAALIKLLKDMPVDDKGSSNQDFGQMMWEAFKYFGAAPAARGHRPPGVRSRPTVSATAPPSAITLRTPPSDPRLGPALMPHGRIHRRRPPSAAPAPSDTILRRAPALAARITLST